MKHPRSNVSTDLRPCLYLGMATCGLVMLASCTPPPQTAESPSPTSPSPSTVSPSPTVTPSLVSPGPSGFPSPIASSPVDGIKMIENRLGTIVAKATGLTLQSVDCPENFEEKAGKTYDCQVVSEVGSFVAVVQPTGQPGQFRWGTKGLLLLSKLDEVIQKSVQGQGGTNVSVDCGGKARPAKAGEVFQCKITDAQGKERIAKVTVQDELGNVSLLLQ